ncbi:MAG: hypothetical protein IJV00_04675 [Clostridia bacterium]|nr:hypothetical protein [Clostridia bacterium]
MKKSIVSLFALILAIAVLCGCSLASDSSSGDGPEKTSAAEKTTGNAATQSAEETSPAPSSSQSVPETSPVTETAAQPDTSPVVDPFDIVDTVKVVDQLDYHKQVVTTDYAAELGYDFGDLEQVVILPALSGIDSDSARAFNKKILDTYSETVEILQNDQEEGGIVNIRYRAYINGQSLGIIMTETYGVQIGGIGTGYSFFYYDLKEDRELTFEEYLSNFGYDRKKFAEEFGGSEEYAEYVETVNEFDDTVGEIPLTEDDLLGCCFDAENGTLFVISTDYFMDESYLIETGIFCAEISR